MFPKIIALSVLCFIGVASQVEASCRRTVVVHRNVAVVNAVVATPIIAAVPVPLFAAGYNPAAFHQGSQHQGNPELEKKVDKLIEVLTQLLQQGKQPADPPVTAQQKPQPKQNGLTFLSDANRCGKCHTGPASKGKLDLSNGLRGLDVRQLALVALLTQDPKAEDAMPPPKSKVAPLNDDEYTDLRDSVVSILRK